MTDSQYLAEVAKRAEAATAGPWRTHIANVTSNKEDDYSNLLAPNIGLIAEVFGVSGNGSKIDHIADADFIAHARQDIPKLLAIIAELTAERKRNPHE